MNNDIKEILNRLNYFKESPNKLSYYPEDLLSREDIWLLLDYITKLQKYVDKTFLYTYEELQEKDKEIERLNNIINKANKILSNILVINDWEHKGKYRPVKNTTSQEVYKSVCMLYGILKTPYRSDYGSLKELKGSEE